MNVGKKNSLLIVDDEKMNLIVLTRILEPEYVIYTATSGERALKIAKEFLPDLILLDVVMPEMDGFQILTELKKSEEFFRIPVIFITSLNSSEEEEKGLSLGAADYISKPFNTMNVKLRIQHQIQIVNQLRFIEHLSMTDHLTSLPNRRSFDDRLHMEWNQAIREHTPISLLMMDLDRFKEYNDQYGHQQGDALLQTVAMVFTKSLKRPGDFAARWGGEEFVVLLPNTPFAGALEVAEKIRSEIEKTRVPCDMGTTQCTTISIGVNTQVPRHYSPTDDFISNADKALYSAKQAGRNRVQGLQALVN